ncbi:MAG: hypothetical protein BGO32_08765 [Bacteroidetes bacterium 37-13]|nr:MAG: hypothetical protein BGO32_08765 [Bacteroidetes bacterium 37-13]
MTIGQFNELLIERQELKSQIKEQADKLPPAVVEAMQVPGAIELAAMLKQLNDLNYQISDAEKSI